MGNQIVPNGPKVQLVLMELFYLGSWKYNRKEQNFIKEVGSIIGKKGLYYLGSRKYNRKEKKYFI